MALMPKKTKFRKQQKGNCRGLSKGGNFIHFGEFAMQAVERGRLTDKQIEAMRVSINRFFQRKGKVWIRIFPDKPVTKKPAETRMGTGKGNVEQWVAVIKPGRILFEVGSVPKELAQNALRRAAAKIGLKTRFVERVEQV